MDILIAFILGIIEGITEWLPISSTGHLILASEFLHMNVSSAFMEMFTVVVQLGAILAVVVLFFKKLWPFCLRKNETNFIARTCKPDVWQMWFKVLVACLPAAVVGILFDDKIDAIFYNWQTVTIMLVVIGVLFIIVETWNEGRKPKINTLGTLTYKMAFIIGLWQLLAAILPGTSRSGATIIGALLLGVSRTVAAEFTFFLAIPVMFGASLLKIVKFGFAFTSTEAILLAVGMVTAFIVSMVAIKFLMGYIKKHNFKVFGYYRIILAVIVAVYFIFIR